MPEAEEIREQQRRTWDRFSGGWEKWDRLVLPMLQPVGDELLRLLEVREDAHHLDVASGTGEPGLTIATQAPKGRVVLTDPAAGMIEVATRSAATRGVHNVELHVCGADELPFADATFDSVSCRFGFMFFPDIPAAVSELKRVLKPGGRLCTAVWAQPDGNPWATIPMGAIATEVDLPPTPPDAPGLFRCAAPGAIGDVFASAGLHDVGETDVRAVLTTASADEYWRYTERILTRCRAEGLDPYQWAAQPLAGRPGPLLDIACGSAPMAAHREGWIGVDVSEAELTSARDRDRHQVVRGSATRLPVRARAVDIAVCSMGMQIIDPVADALAEVARVLRPGGRAVLLLPAGGPVPWREAVTYGRLQMALRQRIRYPNEIDLTSAPLRRTAGSVGLAVAQDERRGFSLPLRDGADADELLASLYLPDVGPRRLAAGRRILGGRIGRELTVPLRRILLDRTGAIT